MINQLRICWITTIVSALILTSCGDDMKEPAVLNIENVKLFDETGNAVGCYPECDDDWTNFVIGDIEALNFTDTLTNLSTSTEPVEFLFVYPNPFNDVQNIAVNSPDTYKLNIAIVDSMQTTLATYSLKINEFENIGLDYSFIGLNHNALYRMYYRITNANDVTIYEGFGDIIGCDTGVQILECYPE